ncbi:hypothetical protein KL933_001142 [Ogataea haglerorum]|uniref:F-box domain-containing protein n=1 Tax=Ogataea haglerorum TaxID=1937702 RepID=A0AAN6D8K2_9ASCO|nr:hypothetical protein KL950_001468 [Ogataea haglerorum]KAG7721176.1 hypothetical protein KL913_000912 [Ogataea haglerorum]KAG7721930.1 hypothetical protein KL949_000908 [Ogataea haglerorum]KAG7730062.1 hypothetical protein KL933_001142 [Ogataea haglerorum]KAG7732511.1 hypothetical protein KL948_001941 [Ogataea haglerorum]
MTSPRSTRSNKHASVNSIRYPLSNISLSSVLPFSEDISAKACETRVDIGQEPDTENRASRKRLNTGGLTSGCSDSEMTDVAIDTNAVVDKTGSSPPSKKRLVDNSPAGPPPVTSPSASSSSSSDSAKMATPSNLVISTSSNYTDELQQLPLPSPSASPIQSGNLADSQHFEGEEYTDDHDSRVIQTKEERAEIFKSANEMISLLPVGSSEVNYLLWSLLQKTDRSTLSSLQETIRNSLRKDLVSLLPSEISMKIFGYLDYESLLRTSEICRSWLKLSMESYDFWKDLLFKDGFIATAEEFESEYDRVKLLNPHMNSCQITKWIYRRRLAISKRWKNPDFQPRRITLPGQGPDVITCLQFDDDKIVAGDADHSITIYDINTGKLRSVLSGHTGGVWAMKYLGNILASGATDRTVRIWNMKQGKCTHIFRGHTSTVRCLEILEPKQIGVDDEGNAIMFPKVPLVVTGSRDSTLYVWRLPITGEDEELPDEPIELDETSNKYLVKVLRGHTGSIRAVSGSANVLVSGSYDANARVWDLRTGECKWLLSGHTERIYSCVLDVKKNRCISGSADNTVRIWDLNTGETVAILEGHQNLVGLVTLSENALVSAAADSTVRIWDPNTGDMKHVLRGHTSAITCIQHNDNIIISGSNGMLKMWDTQTGKFIRDLLDDVDGNVWQVKSDYRRCIAAVQKDGGTYIEILDFGHSDVDSLRLYPNADQIM